MKRTFAARSVGVCPFGVILGLFGTGAYAQTTGFRFVGFPPGSPTQSVVYGLSADGRVAAGNGQSSTGVRGFTWTEDGGRNDFGQLPTMPNDTRVFGLSADASTVVGQTTAADGFGHAYQYAGGVTIRDLGTARGWNHSQANGVSGDGNIVVGTLSNTRGSSGQAFRWTASGGMEALGSPLDAPMTANGVSRDGSVVIGSRLGGSRSDAYIWTQAAGFQYLPSLPGNAGAAYGTNPDASIIVGISGAGTPTMWRNGEPTDLGVPQGATGGRLTAVNADGSVAVGLAVARDARAFLWTIDTGPLFFDAYLARYGISIPTGWTAEQVSSVSDDGRTFGGWAIDSSLHRQGFVVTIPAPPSAMLVACLVGAFAQHRKRL